MSFIKEISSYGPMLCCEVAYAGSLLYHVCHSMTPMVVTLEAKVLDICKTSAISNGLLTVM